MVLRKRKTRVEDATSQVEKIEGLSHDIQAACRMEDFAPAKRVYDRFLSVVEPGITPVETVFPLVLDKRKTGPEVAPCAMEILQDLFRDMQVAVEKKDEVASARIYNRFLAERSTGVVSRFFKAHAPDIPPSLRTQDEVWTRPHLNPTSHM